jgi:drug/metabolite transporter (DMT)-like permease
MIASSGRARAFAALGLVMLLWAGNSIIGRAVRFDVPPFTLALLRWWGAVALLAPFAIAPVARDWPVLRRGWKPVLLLGLLGTGAFNSLLYSGLAYTTATNALLLQAGIPALVVLFDRVLFGVRSSAIQVAGTLLSIAGVVVIVFRADVAAMLALQLGPGDLLVLAAVVVWGLYTVLLRTRPKVSPVSFVFATFLVGALAMVPLAGLELLAGERVRWGWGTAGAIAYVAVLPSIVSYFIYNWAAGAVGPARAGQAITLLPVFGALLSALLLGEALHLYHAWGMALIGLGIVLGALALSREQTGGAMHPPPLEAQR